VSEQSGKTVAYNNVPAEALVGILAQAGVPERFADILANVDQAIERGLLAGRGSDLSRLIGRPTTPIADSIAAALKG
jgi:NAD(P)H dehydrogenase (quinone)